MHIIVSRPLKLLFRLLLVSGFCALIPCTGQAQLGGKPYQQWTAKEAKGLLTDSPWAQTQTGLVSVTLEPTISVSRGLPSSSAGRLDPPTEEAPVTISLRSALPLRQALARLIQLKNKYDQKSDSDKATIDAKNKALLECPECADFYVVAMSPGPESKNGLPANFQRATLAWLKLNVQIKNEKGETRELARFVNAKHAEDDAVFYFSRFNSKGEPLITPANRTLTISFDPHIFAWKKATVTKFEFDVARMISNGQVAF